MKRMCKFIFGIIFSIFMMGIISCSGQDESTNLTIAIDMSGLLPSNESKDSFARSVNDEIDNSYEINLINLETNEKYSKTGPIINNEIHVTFEKVPLFFYGRIEAIIFEGETPIYTGRSKEFTVHERITRISVQMEKVDNPADPDDPEDPADPNDPNQPGDGTGEGSGETGGDDPTEPDDPTDPGNPEDPADPNDPNQPGDGTGEGSGDTGGDNPADPDDPTEPGNPEDPADPNDPNQPGDGTGEGSGETGGDDPEIGDTEKTANYTVKHYQQNAEDDEYTLVETDTENKTGIVGAETSAEAKNYEGFEVREFEQAKIAADGSTEIKIYYDRNRVTLTFETDDGSVVGSIPGKYGAKIQLPPNPTKTGYIFEAWDETLPETFPATDTTFIAQWTPITYTVVFDTGVEDGSVKGEMNSLPCTYDVPNELPENKFTRENFDFVRWNTAKDGSGTSYDDEQEVENLSSTQDAVVTLYAQWHPQSQVKDVDFSVAGGDVNYGTNVKLSCETEGATIYYTFGETEYFSEDWTRYEEFEITIFGENDVDLQKTLRAIAIADGMTNSEIKSQTYTLSSYTVTLNPNGGSLNETISTTQNIYSGKTFDLSNCIPSKTGYTFGGWELNGEIVEKQIITVIDTDIELTAKWTPITYKVVFDANGGNALPSEQKQILTYDESRKLTKNEFTRDGYTFVRWNRAKDGTGTSYADEQEVENLASTQDAEVTLYAQWEKTNIEVLPPSFTEDPVSINKTIGYDNKITFTVVGLDRSLNLSFTWYIDDELVGTGESLTINPDNDVYPAGAYSIRVIVTDENGNVYSAMYDFELIK